MNATPKTPFDRRAKKSATPSDKATKHRFDSPEQKRAALHIIKKREKVLRALAK